MTLSRCMYYKHTSMNEDIFQHPSYYLSINVNYNTPPVPYGRGSSILCFDACTRAFWYPQHWAQSSHKKHYIVVLPTYIVYIVFEQFFYNQQSGQCCQLSFIFSHKILSWILLEKRRHGWSVWVSGWQLEVCLNTDVFV